MDFKPLQPSRGDKDSQFSGLRNALSKLGEFLKHPVRFIHNARIKKEYIKLHQNMRASSAMMHGRSLMQRSVTSGGKLVVGNAIDISENVAEPIDPEMAAILQTISESKIDRRSAPIGSIVHKACLAATQELPFREVNLGIENFTFTSNTSRAKGTSFELLREYATDPTDAGVLKKSVQKRKEMISISLRDLEIFLKNPHLSKEERVVLDPLAQQLRTLDTALAAKLDYLDQFSKIAPLSKKALQYALETIRDAALAIIDREIRDEKDQKRLKTLDGIRTSINKLTQNTANSDNLVKEIKTFPKKLTGIMKKGFSKKQAKLLKKRLARERIHVLMKKEWAVVSKEIQLSNPRTGKLLPYRNTIIPASKMGNIIGKSYAKDGIGGVPSLDMTSPHAVNMALSRTTNPNGDVITEVMRVGVLSAAEIRPGEKRKQVNLQRGKELYTALVTTNEAILKDALDGKNPKVTGLAISVETPDAFRHVQSKISSNYKHDEYRQTQEQLEVHKALQGLQTINVLEGDKEREVKVNFEIKMMSVGVNPGATGKTSALTGGWGAAKAINEETFNWLFRENSEQGPGYKMDDGTILDGKVGATLMHLENKGENRTEEENKILKNLKEVSKQIIGIYEGNTYKKGGIDPYKLASRLVTLGNLLRRGSNERFVVMVNCKSAKDRTNHLVTESIFQAARADMGLAMIPPDVQYSEQQRNMFAQIALNSGGAQIQKYNTGIEGQKTKGVNLHLEGEALRTLIGGSSLAPT